MDDPSFEFSLFMVAAGVLILSVFWWGVLSKSADVGTGSASATANSAAPNRGPITASSRRQNVFVSYRREESADITGRITDRLVQRFGSESIFKDVDSIPLGKNFATHLDEALSDADVLIAVIGRRWVTIAGHSGERRLAQPDDYVRFEIASALRRNIPVIPVLVQGATVPAATDMPPELGQLTQMNGLSVRPDPDFDRDIERLIDGIEACAQPSKPKR